MDVVPATRGMMRVDQGSQTVAGLDTDWVWRLPGASGQRWSQFLGWIVDSAQAGSGGACLAHKTCLWINQHLAVYKALLTPISLT